MIEFGRQFCNNFESVSSHEWLVTNGIGGYAAGTVAGVLSRRYHGLLIAALEPPLERTLLVSKFDEIVYYQGQSFPLFTNYWQGGELESKGFIYLESFRLEGTTPVWTYTLADVQLEKRIWMQPGENTTYIHYKLCRAAHSITLTIKTLVNYRDHHSSTRAEDWQMQVIPVEKGLRFTAFKNASPFYLFSTGAKIIPKHQWYQNYYLNVEDYRGLNATEDIFHAGEIHTTLSSGQSIMVIASTEKNPNLNGQAAYVERQAYEEKRIAQSQLEKAPSNIQQLVLAADQFIVQRATSVDEQGHSIIAGYPWFGDWGRDTMIALPGLTLATGRFDIAKSILQTFAHFVDQGMLPNRFPEIDQEPEYNTVDATLWYFEALRAYLELTKDDNLLKELFPILKDIIDWHKRGTRYNIHMDPEDGLLYAGTSDVQLTWMDAKVGDWVVTPRTGKAVEINSLWYNALRIMSEFAKRLNASQEEYTKLANRVHKNFSLFWNEEKNCCFDVISGPHGNDLALRPNQLFAVSLHHSPLTFEQQRAIVDTCARNLLTPHGLRSLAPGAEDYAGRYGGDQRQRDGTYHQGTVWGWLIGPFVQAHLRVYKKPVLARSYLKPLLQHLSAHGVGSISEIFDGDPPFTPRGCFAQAWSVAEVLRVWQLTDN
jgi:predicted glycogen debranching enzyme